MPLHPPGRCTLASIYEMACTQTRQQTAEDNRLAPTSHTPTGGPHGPDTCKQRLVQFVAEDDPQVDYGRQ